MEEKLYKFIISVKYKESRRDELFSVEYEIEALSVEEALAIANKRFRGYESSSSATWVRTMEGKPSISIEIDGALYHPEESSKVASLLPELSLEQKIIMSQWLIIVDPVRADDAISALLALEQEERTRAKIVSLLSIEKKKPMVKALEIALLDPDGRVRANAVEAVEELGRKDLVPMLVPLASDPNNRARANAIKAISVLGESSLLDTLKQMLKSRDRWMRASAVYAMGEMDDPNVNPLLFSALKEEDAVVRFNALRAILKIFKPEMVDEIIKNMDLSDPMMVYFLESILEKMEDMPIETIKAYLKDPDMADSAPLILDRIAYLSFVRRQWLRFIRLAFRIGL